MYPQFYILHFTFPFEILRRFAPQDDRRGSNTNARLCHPELVVARLCCQHFADGKMLDLQGGSSSFPKISLRCDFREPCFSAQSNGSLKIIPSLSFRPRRHTPMLSAFCRTAKRSTCKAAPPLPKNLASLRFSGALLNRRVEKSCAVHIGRQTPPLHAFTLFKGEGGTRCLLRVTNEGCSILILSTPTITRTVSPHLVAGKAPWQTARCACRLARCACRSSSQKVLRYFLGALFARARSLRGKPCIEPCSERLTVLYKIPLLGRSLLSLPRSG